MTPPWKKGYTYESNKSDGIWSSGIDIGLWGHQVIVHGESKEDAEAIRDRILAALFPLGYI